MADEPEADYPTWRRAWRGKLSWEEAIDNRLVSHQIEWIEGLVHQGQGSPDLAEERFAEARKDLSSWVTRSTRQSCR